MSKPRVPKLTDEELSRVLGQAAIGKLTHAMFGIPAEKSRNPECGCVAGASLALGETVSLLLNEGLVSKREWNRAWDISNAVSPDPFGDYPGRNDPDAILRYLESRGLA